MNINYDDTCRLTDQEFEFFRDSINAWRTPCPYIECDGISCKECPLKELTDKMLDLLTTAREILKEQEALR